MDEIEIMLLQKDPSDPAHECARKTRAWLYDLYNLLDGRISPKMTREIYCALGEWLIEDSIEKIVYTLFMQEDTRVLLSLDKLTQFLIQMNKDEKNSYQ